MSVLIAFGFKKKKGTIDEMSAFAVGVSTIANKNLMMCLQFLVFLISRVSCGRYSRLTTKYLPSFQG